jgi:uncharacterized protein (DUF697 family)
MLPKTKSKLDMIKKECYSLATKRATAAAGAAAIPLPGVDIAADIGLLLEAMPEIVRKFGLTKEDIDSYDEQRKVMIYSILKKLGIETIGVLITEELIKKILFKMAGRVAVKSVTKYIPFIGTAIAASVGFAAMKYLLDDLTDDCFKVSLELIDLEGQH